MKKKVYILPDITKERFGEAYGGVNDEFYYDYVNYLSGKQLYVSDPEGAFIEGRIRINFIRDGRQDYWNITPYHAKLIIRDIHAFPEELFTI